MTPLKKRMILRYRDFRMDSTIDYKEEIERPPPQGFTGIDQFTKSLQKIKDATGLLPMAMSSSNDPATVWRMFYTLAVLP
jgi:hypothetical protein